jgi:hypothetical protein
MKLEEGKCEYQIIALVNGERKEINCNSETRCLKDLVWCGIGVTRAAALLLGRSVKGVYACVKGNCVGETSSDPLQR